MSQDFMKSAGFHKICQISQNPLDFVKSAGFHEIRQISCEICQISKDQQLPGMVRPMIFDCNISQLQGVDF